MDISRASTSTVREALLLQEEILKHVPLGALLKRPELTEGAQAATVSQSPYGFACTFYGIKPTSKVSTHKDSSSVPFASALGDVVGLSTSCARSLLVSTRPLALRDVFAQLLLLVGMLVDKLEGKLDAPIEVSWNPTEWLSAVLGTLELEVYIYLVDKSPFSRLIIGLDYQLYRCGPHCGSRGYFASNNRTEAEALD
jgi:hypothetical protein